MYPSTREAVSKPPPTTHSEPIYVEEGVVHYCVTNMPAATARTSTLALTQATLPYALQLASLGVRKAMAQTRGWQRPANPSRASNAFRGRGRFGLSSYATGNSSGVDRGAYGTSKILPRGRGAGFPGWDARSPAQRMAEPLRKPGDKADRPESRATPGFAR